MEITRSPLCWPSWFPRTQPTDRTAGRFGKRNDNRCGLSFLTLAEARRRLLDQVSTKTNGKIWGCDPDSVIISTNLALRNDGLPRSGQPAPKDPGVAVYFELGGKPRCIPCDKYKRVEDNIAAIAATIEALRTLERHGSNMFEAAFTGFTALPSPDQISQPGWRQVLDYYGSSLSEAKEAYLRKRKVAHPDHGGSVDDFSAVEQAWREAQEQL